MEERTSDKFLLGVSNATAAADEDAPVVGVAVAVAAGSSPRATVNTTRM
jgi:hypothetical protein